ncbi:MAG: hypothetical protein R6W72_03520, partial [Desulfurivibrionaceae bacterium]
LDRYRDSLDAFKIGIGIHHPEHTRLLLAGMEAMLLDAAAGAEGRAQLNLEDAPESVYGRMAFVFLREKDYKNARTYLTKALALAPADKTILSIKKLYDAETAENRRARRAINSASQLAPSTGFRFKAALYLAGFIETKYTVLNPLVGPLLKTAVQLEPESLPAALELARWQMRNGRVEEALNFVEHHRRDNPNSPPLLEMAGQVYIMQDKKEKAAVVLNQLLEVYPGHPAWNSYARFINTYGTKAETSEQ